MKKLNSITETDSYIQLFECVHKLVENQGKLTITSNSELEAKMDYLSMKVYGGLVTKEFYRKPIDVWEKVLHQLSLIINELLLPLDSRTLNVEKVERLKGRVKKYLISKPSKNAKRIV